MVSRLIKGVLFDMDGLLLDTERIALRCFQESSTDLGFPLPIEILNQLVGRNSRDADVFLQSCMGDAYPASAVRLGFRQRYEQHLEQNGVDVKPGLGSLIEALNRAQIPRMVATSTRREMAEWKLRRAGIAHYFSGITGGDEVARGKPAPDIFLLAAARLGVPPTDCLVLEDSAPGIQAALSAGMQAILIPDIVSPEVGTLPSQVRVAATLDDVASWIV